ncbi:MAG: DEAD/DEAH box helicase, partial [Oscillospiraceae bacterium]|nr:DEAD/DEAH box helicase [Oscillospiraceae bacterium]
MALTLDTSIQFLKGVGEKRAQLYAKLGIRTVRELLYHFPRQYIDLSAPISIMDAPLHENCAIRAKLTYKSGEQRIRAGLSVFKLIAQDHTGSLEVTVFNSKFTVERLETDHDYIFVGPVGGSILKREMSAPSIYPIPEKHAILPVYPQTSGVSSTLMRRNILQALEELTDIPDMLSDAIRQKYGFPHWMQSMRVIHFPESLSQVQTARDRFVFEELLTLCCALAILHSGNEAQQAPAMAPLDIGRFYQSLPFQPTAAQLRAIDESISDMGRCVPMNRLIQGDVGSGKTLVAAACIYFAFLSGFQSTMMAPTEILAEQHYNTLRAMLEPLGMTIALLTGSTRAAEKKRIASGLLDGGIDLCIGTHALLSDGVDFKNPGLVVTDEQHRFGVAQRARLSGKSSNAHVMVMSATPIPRTLSLIVYGDLSLSVIDEIPPGR